MKVTVIGGTGRIGKRVSALLVEHGHDVLAVNRRPDRAAAVLGGLALRTRPADTGNALSMALSVDGADAVVLATAPTREHPDAYLGQTRNVLQAVKEAGVARLVALSNYVALRAPDGRPMLEAEPPNPYFRAVDEVFSAQADLFRQERDLDWLLVAPPAELFPYGEVTRRYRVGEDVLLVTDPDNDAFKEVSTLSMEELAAFVVDEVERPRHSRALVTLAY